MAKAKPEPRTHDEVRGLILRYFYDRNENATRPKGKKGSAVKISDVKSELKALHGLTQQEVQSNLTYLISMGWVEEDVVKKQFPGKQGTLMPSTTSFYRITAAGIDKIQGHSDFTMDKFHGIKIEATGQNIITLGDGNRINAKFAGLGEALALLRDAVTASTVEESEKFALVADIETIQTQLAKPSPSKAIIAAAWSSVKAAANIQGCAALVATIAPMIAGLIQ